MRRTSHSIKFRGTCRTYFRPKPKDFRFTRASNLKFRYLWPTERDNATQLRWCNITYCRVVLECKNAPEELSWVFIGFQSEKNGRQTSNPAVFDHVNLKNIYVILNSTIYPAVDYNLSFANQQFSRAYGDASVFGVKYFGMDELITRSKITPVDYKTLYPLFVFDVTKQSDDNKMSVVY